MAMSLKAARINTGLSGEEASKLIGVSRDTLYSWEAEKTYPTVDKIATICRAYDCDVDDIIFCTKNTE